MATLPSALALTPKRFGKLVCVMQYVAATGDAEALAEIAAVAAALTATSAMMIAAFLGNTSFDKADMPAPIRERLLRQDDARDAGSPRKVKRARGAADAATGTRREL